MLYKSQEESLKRRLELLSVARRRRYFNLNKPALIATITVLRLINTALAAGLNRIPCLEPKRHLLRHD